MLGNGESSEGGDGWCATNLWLLLKSESRAVIGLQPTFIDLIASWASSMEFIWTNWVVCGSRSWLTISSLSSSDLIETRGAMEGTLMGLGFIWKFRYHMQLSPFSLPLPIFYIFLITAMIDHLVGRPSPSWKRTQVSPCPFLLIIILSS